MKSLSVSIVLLAGAISLFGGDCFGPMPGVGNELGTPGLFEAAPPPFVVIVSADRLTGAPGTAFRMDARIAGNASAIRSFEWRINRADPASTENEPQFTFDAPGDYIVEATIDDDQGRRVTDGVLLKVFDPAAASSSKSTITPGAGMPGTLIQVQSPALDDPQAIVQVMIGDGASFEPYRPELGLANFVMPFDAAANLTQAKSIPIKLLVGGDERDRMNFTLSPAPALGAPAGRVAMRWFEATPGLLDIIERDLLAFYDGIDAGLTMEERALTQSMLQFVRFRIEQVRDAVLPQLDAMDDATRTMLDQILMANGITLDELDKLANTAKRIHSSKNSEDAVLDLLCMFHDVIDDLNKAIEGLSTASAVLPVLAIEGAGTAVAPVIMGWANAISELSIAKAVIAALAELVPRVQDELQVTATPNQLMNENEKAVIRVRAMLQTRTDICSQALDQLAQYLAGEITKQFFAQLKGSIPTNILARIAYNHTVNIPNAGVAPENIRALEEVRDSLADIASNIASMLITSTGMDALLMAIKTKLCALDERGGLDLQPEESILKQSPPGSGTLLNLQDETIDFYCSINTRGSVTIRAERTCGIARSGGGGPRKLMGTTSISCAQEDCTEDASQWITLNITPTNMFTIPSTCMVVTPELHRQDAIITLTNTHATRTVKIAAIKYKESDQQTFPRGICSPENLLPGQTLQDCLFSSVGGCDHAFSGPSVGFSSFLQAGETSAGVPFICEQEFIYLPGGAGTCGEAALETVTENWIVQAVFCDNFENTGAFCDQVRQDMLQFGQASAVWSSKESNGCSAN